MSPQSNSEVPSSQCKKGNTASYIIFIIKKIDSTSSEETNFKLVPNSKINLSLKEDIILYSKRSPKQPSKNQVIYMAISSKSFNNVTLKCNSALQILKDSEYSPSMNLSNDLF